MDDLISRQTAIDALKEAFNPSITNFVKAKMAIDALPPAQPEHCGDAVSRNAIVQKLNKMDRYVSAELRLCDTDDKFPQNEVFIVDDVYEEIVEQLPSTQPEIIRCKDCKHWIPYDWMFSEVWQSKNIADYPEDDIGCDCSEMAMKANDFCSYAERRRNAKLD